MKNKNSNTTNPSAKKLLLVALVVTVLAASGLFYARQRTSRMTSQAPMPQPTSKINLGPPTPEDKLRADQNKQAILDREKQLQDQQSTADKKTVTPVMTYAGQYGLQVEIGGYVPGVFEDGGTCTAKFSQGSLTFNKSVTGVKGASSVDCPVMVAKNEEFTQKGAWTVVLSYTSASAAGSSLSKQVEVK